MPNFWKRLFYTLVSLYVRFPRVGVEWRGAGWAAQMLIVDFQLRINMRRLRIQYGIACACGASTENKIVVAKEKIFFE